MNLENIQKLLKKKKIDAFLVTNLRNLRYLTGFTGSSGFALITKDRGLFFTDFRYREQAEKEVKKCEIIIEKSKRTNTISKMAKKLGINKLGFETTISYSFFDMLDKKIIEMLPVKNLMERFRKLKNEDEMDNLKKAIQRAEDAFLKIKPYIKIGVRESELALRLEYQIKKEGCKSIPFDIIVASGKNSSMPHAKPSDKKIKDGDFVIIDWGAECNGYFSDMTRTFLMYGNDISEKRRIYEIVNTARDKAIITAQEGVKAKEIDAAARNIIKKEGYARFFGHGTGHGVGLDVHESPSISQVSNEIISESMVFTIEPGIYITDIGGVRIEDMVTIKEGSAVVLTTLPREIEIVKHR